MGKSRQQCPTVWDDNFTKLYPFVQLVVGVRSAGIGDTLMPIAFDREDLEQEALLGVWMALRRFDPARASLRTYIERVVATSVVSVVRRAKTKKRMPVALWPEQSSIKLFLAVELRRDLDRALRSLKRRDKQIAQLLVEYRPAEIAHILGVSGASVYRSISNIRTAFSQAGIHR